MIDLLIEITKSILTTTIDHIFFKSFFGSIIFSVSFAILEWAVKRLYSYLLGSEGAPRYTYKLSENSETIAIIGALFLTIIFLITPPISDFIPGIVALTFVFMGGLALMGSLFFAALTQNGALNFSTAPDWIKYIESLGYLLFFISLSWAIVIALQYPELNNTPKTLYMPKSPAEIKVHYALGLVVYSVVIFIIGNSINRER